MRKEHSCPESKPVLRFDLLKFLVDELLDALSLFVEMRQLARAFQPRLVFPPLAYRKLLFDGLRDEFAQRDSQGARCSFGLTKGLVRNLQSCHHSAIFPYLWEFGRPWRKGSSLQSGRFCVE